ncbi:carboxypeptidase-like regulatory domain-containing protein [Pedobacter sp. P351]|uniref:carboxypeptidase-like regulatory domain-containing protein n=1 Tax=Pedobacter superstes TaxID=3133441 RepID=UPI0030B1F9BB
METNRINYITIQQYLDGLLDKEAMHELEKQALDDPFLADALDGYAHINKPAAKQLSLLQTQLEERIARQQENKNVFNFSWQRLSVAAAAGLLFVTASILFWIKGQNSEEQLASNPKQVEVILSPIDSLDTAGLIKEQAELAPPVVQSLAGKSKQEGIEKVQIAALKQKRLQQGDIKLGNTSDAISESAIDGNSAQEKQLLAENTSNVSLQGRIAGISSEKIISGKIISNNGAPLPGVSVQLRNTGIGTATNVNGEFSLRDSVGGDLKIAFIGFNSKEVKATPGIPLTVALEENSQAMNEVVVRGYGTAKKLNESPEPLIGWNKYNDYIQKSVAALKGEFSSGLVVVSFTVGDDNKLSNFQIKRGLDDKNNQEAIRLIKDGPGWKSSKHHEARVTVEFK